MQDLSELLMIEHSSIRIVALYDILKNEDFFYSFTDYLDNCHVQVEEKIYFPTIVNYEWNDKADFIKTVDRIKADHRLIKKLGDNLKDWKSSGDELFNRRLPLYYKTVTEHNLSEEISIFPRWKKLEKEAKLQAIDQSQEIIKSFGFEKYKLKTGISDEFLKYIFDYTKLI